MIFDRKVIDSHVHITGSEEETDRLFKEFDDLGVYGAALQSLAASPKYGIEQNLVMLKCKRDYKGIKLYAYGSLHETGIYAKIPYLKQAEALLDMGCEGMKFLQMKPDLRKIVGKGVCHEDYDPTFSMLEERGIPVTMHVADPYTFWDITKISPASVARGWFYGDGTYMSYEEHYAEVFAMLDKHPKLKLTLAHLFFLDNNIDEARRVMEKYPNVSLDLTPHPAMYLSFAENYDAWRSFFIDYQDRIIYGTDSHDERERQINIHKTVFMTLTEKNEPFYMPAFYYDKQIYGFDLPSEVVDKIVCKNFESRITPVPVNEGMMLDAAERMLRDIKDDPALEKNASWLRSLLKSN